MRPAILGREARFLELATDELISFPGRHSKPVSHWLILGHASTICADRISWDYTKGQTERRARPLRLARSRERSRGENKVRPMKKRSSNLSCSPLRGMGMLSNSYLRFGACVETFAALTGWAKLWRACGVGDSHCDCSQR